MNKNLAIRLNDFIFFAKIGSIITVILFLTGCCSGLPPCDAKEREDRDRRMRQMLAETSPRALNQVPKAIPEFRSRFRTDNGCDDCPEDE